MRQTRLAPELGCRTVHQTPGRYSWQFNSREADQLQATAVAAWEEAMDVCRQALQHLHCSSAAACTSEQAISQYHPSAALEFRMQTAGIVEKARFEIDRRSRTARQNPMTHSWLDRARQTAKITQELEQAAVESVEALKTVLQGQSWDHKMVGKLHDDKLREMENQAAVDVAQVECVEAQQARLQEFMVVVQVKEREDLRTMLKEKEKLLRIRQVINVIDINA